MNILKKLPQLVQEKEPIKVYCQNVNCGRELTSEGGDISSSGRIYCHRYKEDLDSKCFDYELMLMVLEKIHPGVFTYRYRNARQTQKAIRKDQLTKFSLSGAYQNR